jgi:hypothetical protein
MAGFELVDVESCRFEALKTTASIFPLILHCPLCSQFPHVNEQLFGSARISDATSMFLLEWTTDISHCNIEA